MIMDSRRVQAVGRYLLLAFVLPQNLYLEIFELVKYFTVITYLRKDSRLYGREREETIYNKIVVRIFEREFYFSVLLKKK